MDIQSGHTMEVNRKIFLLVEALKNLSKICTLKKKDNNTSECRITLKNKQYF